MELPSFGVGDNFVSNLGQFVGWVAGIFAAVVAAWLGFEVIKLGLRWARRVL